MSYPERLLSRAVEVARTSEHRWRLGAVASRGSNILHAAVNSYRQPPWLDEGRNASWHAEEALLRYFRGAAIARPDIVAVARVGRAGDVRLARPCFRCWKLLMGAGVTTVLYTISEGNYGVEKVTRCG